MIPAPKSSEIVTKQSILDHRRVLWEWVILLVCLMCEVSHIGLTRNDVKNLLLSNLLLFLYTATKVRMGHFLQSFYWQLYQLWFADPDPTTSSNPGSNKERTRRGVMSSHKGYIAENWNFVVPAKRVRFPSQGTLTMQPGRQLGPLLTQFLSLAWWQKLWNLNDNSNTWSIGAVVHGDPGYAQIIIKSAAGPGPGDISREPHFVLSWKKKRKAIRLELGNKAPKKV